MPKAKLFDEESEEEVSIKTENEYAKKYDAWREKEELHKLEQKYGSKPLNSEISLSSDSEDENDEPPEVSEEVEKQFLKTLALLKTKDPRIYDPNFKFFDDKVQKEKEKEPETKKVTFGDSDDDEDDDDQNIFSIEKKAEIDEDKESKEKSSKDEKIKDFLIGKAEHVDEEVENDLAPLRALWSDPKLNDGEAFLRDYILNKRYLEDGDAGDAGDKVRDDDELEEDEKTVEEQGKFERAYNFRFEEPDEEYLKRFPRTMNYIRPKDDRRSRKRAEIRERKEEEKKRKMEEIARLKALKLKEIQEKIAKIKEVTGNKDLAFKDEDIEGDFDPEEHDKRMKAIFDEEYYGEADDQKPVFPDLDEELEIENWENYEEEYDRSKENEDDEPHCEDKDFNMDADYDPKKAKENLLEELKRNMGKKRRNRKRKSKLAELLSEEKPKFVPDVDKTYDEFMQEYYAMDCEDVIGGDLPTRFKYRQVVPNDFGLTVEEILLADDKELTQWVPLKKMVKYRPENVEKGEVKMYSQKAADVNLKKKVLPSLFKDLPEEPELVVPIEESKKKKKKKKKNKKENPGENTTEIETLNESNEVENTTTDIHKKKKRKHSENGDSNINLLEEENTQQGENIKKKNKKSKTENVVDDVNITKEDSASQTSQEVVEDSTLVDQDSKKKKNKHKKVKTDSIDDENLSNKETNNTSVVNELSNISTKDNTIINVRSEGKKKKKKAENNFNVENVNNKQTPSNAMNNQNGTVNNLKRKLDTNSDIPKKKKKKNKNKQIKPQQANNKDLKKKANNKTKQNDKSDPLSKLSDERLKAYGLNPKKYRGFLKYKKF